MPSSLEFSPNGAFRHLLNLNEFSREFTLQLFKQAEQFLINTSSIASVPLLVNKTIATLFFEASTRTRVSFDLAAKKLGANVINLNLDVSSAQKGETVIDTIANLAAMSIDIFVLRHGQDNLPEQVAKHFNTLPVSFVNAGDGKNSHPSQALLDAFTIYQYYRDFSALKIVIVGDLLHSRVARSNLKLLQLLGAKNIVLVAPQNLLPSESPTHTVQMSADLDQAMQGADVVMALRLQKERMQHGLLTTLDDYHKQYGLTEERLALANKKVIVMHPGPMNRGVEIASSVADGKHAVILQQVRNGVAMRMAILAKLAGS